MIVSTGNLYNFYNISNLHPPSPETTGMPVEEGENDGTASADSARHVGRMNPAKLQHESFGAKTGHLKGTTRMRVGLHATLQFYACIM